MNLAKRLSVYYIPHEDFYDSYDDEAYDLAVLDEFGGQKTPTWLNMWLDGQPMPLRKKGSQCMKYNNLPTIICSNSDLFDCYNAVRQERLDALAERLTIIYCDHFLDIQLPEPPVPATEVTEVEMSDHSNE